MVKQHNETQIKKKTYRKPVLSAFGSIAQLTQSHFNGPFSDSGKNMMGS